MGKKKKSKVEKAKTAKIKAHQCALAKERKFKKVKRIVRRPEYICRGCLRIADHKRNLCKPTGLTEI